MATPEPNASTDERILDVTLELLEAHGMQALTTRAVCEAAGVSAPTLYHHFRDKDGLLAALLRREIERFLHRKKHMRQTSDPGADLRRGWDEWIAFATAHPNLVAMVRHHADAFSQATEESHRLLVERVRRVAAAGRLAGKPEQVARALLAASMGVVDVLLQGADRETFDAVNALVRDALFAAVVLPAEVSGGAARRRTAARHRA
jgi:AcrR family transcriptional regulator